MHEFFEVDDEDRCRYGIQPKQAGKERQLRDTKRDREKESEIIRRFGKADGREFVARKSLSFLNIRFELYQSCRFPAEQALCCNSQSSF